MNLFFDIRFLSMKIFTVYLSFLITSFASANESIQIWEVNWSSFSEEARSILKEHCLNDAYQEIYKPINNVKSILRIDEYNSDQAFVGGIGKYYDHYYPAGGLHYSNKKYMFFRLGLEEIEFLYPKRIENKVGVFNLYKRETSYRETMKSKYAIKFISTATPKEERLGIRGRDIEIVDLTNGELLAKRKEYFWINPDSSKAAGGLVCPGITEGQMIPKSFLSRVINKDSYGCWYKYESMINKKKRTKMLGECENEYLSNQSFNEGN